MKLTIEICNIDDAEKAKKILDAYAPAGLVQPKQYGERDVLSEPISDLMLETGSRNALLGTFGNITVGELIKKTERNLLAVPNFGRKSLRELKTLLAELGLELTSRYGGSNV